MRKKVAIGALVFWLTAGGTPNQGRAGVIPLPFATEWTQLLNHAQLLNQYIRQGVMLENQLQQYANMIQNGLVLSTQVFGPIAEDLSHLAQVVQGGRALAYSMANLDVQFRNAFPGYTFNPLYYQNYKKWSQTSLDTTQSTLKAVGLQAEQLRHEQALLASLRQMAQTSVGRMQALQVGNEIAEQQVQQLMKLRGLILADLQSKQAFQAAQIQKEQANAAAEEQFFNYAPVQSDGTKF
jgi:P-type conjugative transfer protein TrbJ